MADEKRDNGTICKYHFAIERAIADHEKLVSTQLKNMQSAVDLARDHLETRLAGMNEFRKQLDKQSQTFVTSEAHNILQTVHDERIKVLENAKSKLEGRIAGIGIVFLVIQFLVYYYLK